MMKDLFNRFVIQFLTAVLLGFLLLCLHPWSGRSIMGILTPAFVAPWEMSKLAYWPLLGTLLLTGKLTGGIMNTFRRGLPCLASLPVLLVFAFWGISALEPAAGIYLLIWIAAMALGLAWVNRERTSRMTAVWMLLAVALGILYAIFAFFPPMTGPFLDPADVAAMGTIPC